ncbi:hypothetical protein F4777DRAFT_21333 [Nemania sp. FL0916]|nr:hypothetical protein F4777DRAFT_21333 [Nemania sp. FL0916]
MPVIDGIKVACVPCIRGHRSTKCTHQAERVMVPVRKPGRPLTSCPHPKGKPCTCNNITAAIPRNGKCQCGTAEPEGIDTRVVTKTEPSASEAAPMSPTRPAPFRIQKHTNAKSHSRKQSYDVSLLSQMDPSSLNVMPNHDMAPGTNGSMNHTQPMPSPSFMANFRPNISHGLPLGPSLDYAQMLGRLDGTDLNAFFENSHGTVSDASPLGLLSNGTSGQSSLGASRRSFYTPVSDSSSSDSCAKGLPMESMSCCGKSSITIPPVQGHSEKENQSRNVMSSIRYGNPIPTNAEMPALDFNNSVDSRQIMHQTPQDPVYTYPSQYGSSFYEPLQYAQWQQMMTSQIQSIPTRNGYTPPQASIDTTEIVPSPFTAHQCGCGDGCQCLGCAAHPFNAATQEYVLSVMQGEHVASPSISNGENGVHQVGTGEMSPAILSSPLAGSSPASETGSTGMNDYLFVAYCPGSPQSCPCGDECACVGCMIHGQPAPMTPVTPP